jgi:hypothetical protein
MPLYPYTLIPLRAQAGTRRAQGGHKAGTGRALPYELTLFTKYALSVFLTYR